MSGLRSVVDQAVAEDDRSTGSFGLAERIIEITDAQNRLDALVAVKVARFNSQGGPGELGSRALFEISNAVPAEFAEAEEVLVEIVEPLSVIETKKALEYWRQSVDGPGDLDLEVQQLRRGISVSRTIGGMTRVDGWLTTNAGEALSTALDAHMPPPGEDDRRTPRQRRHDALEEMTRCHLDHGDTPIAGGEKPHMLVLTDLDALQNIAGGGPAQAASAKDLRPDHYLF